MSKIRRRSKTTFFLPDLRKCEVSFVSNEEQKKTQCTIAISDGMDDEESYTYSTFTVADKDDAFDVKKGKEIAFSKVMRHISLCTARAMVEGYTNFTLSQIVNMMDVIIRTVFIRFELIENRADLEGIIKISRSVIYSQMSKITKEKMKG